VGVEQPKLLPRSRHEDVRPEFVGLHIDPEIAQHQLSGLNGIDEAAGRRSGVESPVDLDTPVAGLPPHPLAERQQQIGKYTVLISSHEHDQIGVLDAAVKIEHRVRLLRKVKTRAWEKGFGELRWPVKRCQSLRNRFHWIKAESLPPWLARD